MAKKTTNPIDPRTLITPSAAAQRLGVHTNTILRWIANGDLPARRLGRSWYRLDPADVDAMLSDVVVPDEA